MDLAPREAAEKLYQAAMDLEWLSYEDYREETTNSLESAIKKIQELSKQDDCFIDFLNCLEQAITNNN